MVEARLWVATMSSRGPSRLREASGVWMKEPGDVVAIRERGLRTLDSSPAGRRGRMMGERKEEKQRRLREIKGALIKGLSLLSFDRGKEVGRGGGLQ